MDNIFGEKKYKSIDSSLPSLMTEYVELFEGTAHKYIVFNDSINELSSIKIKINSINNDSITIKAGEYFGEETNLHYLYIINESDLDVPFRAVIGEIST